MRSVAVGSALVLGCCLPSAAAAAPTITGLRLDAAALSPDGDGHADAVGIAFVSAVEQDVLVYVADRTGRVVQTISSGVLPAAPAVASWDGAGSDGATVVDGPYDVVVEAHLPDGSRSLARARVQVDRVAPVARTTSAVLELAGDGVPAFELPLALSEAARVEVRFRGGAGSGGRSFAVGAGAHRLTVPIATRARLRRALRRGAPTLRLRLVAVDVAGNRTTSIARLELVRGTLAWPVRGSVSSPFGLRWGRRHEGLDVAAPAGRRIRAADGGVVAVAGWIGGYGNAVVIDHGVSSTLYGHQSRLVARRGQVVRRGQTIGFVGSTGHSTGPHLHFEVRVAGRLVDPLLYLPPNRLGRLVQATHSTLWRGPASTIRAISSGVTGGGDSVGSRTGVQTSRNQPSIPAGV